MHSPPPELIIIDTMSERTWIVIARVERKGKSLYKNTLTDRDLSRMAKSYNEEFRKAPIICGFDLDTKRSVPGHEAEIFPPLGFIHKLEYDGLNLWAESSQILDSDGVGRVDKAIRNGYIGRSIGAWPALPELDDNPPYLRHVALLGAEQSGIANLPPLTNYWKSSGEGIGRDIGAMPYMVRSITNEKGIEQMDENALQAMISSVVSAALKPLADKVAEIESSAKSVESLSRSVESLSDEAKGHKLNANLSRVDSLVSSGRLVPAAADATRMVVRSLSDKDANDYLRALESVSPVVTPDTESINAESNPDAARRYGTPNTVKFDSTMVARALDIRNASSFDEKIKIATYGKGN